MQNSLSELKLDYVDLIANELSQAFQTFREQDWPPLALVGCWKGLERGAEIGPAKAIGVTNFRRR